MNIYKVNGIKSKAIYKKGSTPYPRIQSINSRGSIELGSPFITEWYFSSANTTITLPLYLNSNLVYNFTVFWGDGTSNVVTAYNDDDKTHTYINPGTYDISMYGTFEGLSFSGTYSANYITKVIKWGSNNFKHLRLGFWTCNNLIEIVDTEPIISSETDFAYCFSSTGLTTVPENLFKNCTSAVYFNLCLYQCYNLLTVPQNLFKYCIAAESFQGCFVDDNKLQLNKYIFYGIDEESTRFLNKSINFQECFSLNNAFTGVQGEAPELWNCNFGTGTVISTETFYGHNALTLSNYSSIPQGWGGA